MVIVQVNNHDGFKVVKSDSGSWFYTKLDINKGKYDLEVEHRNGKWWITKADEAAPTDYKQLMKEFRKKVEENGKR